MKRRLAFVFSGGGGKGAFGVGVFSEIARRYAEMKWQVVSGTSTGSLITPLAALASSDRAEVENLRRMYAAARKKDILKSNFEFPAILRAFVELPEGIYSILPLRKLLDEGVPDEKMQRLAESDTVVISNAVSLQTGRLVLCTQERHRPGIQEWFDKQAAAGHGRRVSFMPFRLFKESLLASSAIPAAMDPIRLPEKPGVQYVDGGVVDVAPLRAAIAAGATDLVVVIMSPRKVPRGGEYRDVIAVGQRALDLMTTEIMVNDIQVEKDLTQWNLLARLLVAEDSRSGGTGLPPPLRDWVAKNRARVERVATLPPLRIHVVEPRHDLGDGLDFDSQVPRGWPEQSKGPLTPIMEARIAYGARVATRRLEEDEGLRQTLSRF